jgi:hypothetical protein
MSQAGEVHWLCDGYAHCWTLSECVESLLPSWKGRLTWSLLQSWSR